MPQVEAAAPPEQTALPPDAAASEGAQPDKNLLDQARDQYPILKNHDIGYTEAFGRSKGYLESWPAGEEGGQDLPRPKELAPDKFGIEIYDKKTRPIDVLGDVVSHKLINDDPKIKQHYEEFQDSMKPWQKKNLKAQFEHDKREYGEDRSYDDWEKSSGMPAYFRGYPFKQWDDPKEMYTPGQMKKLDKMMDYLKGKEEPSGAKALYDHPRSQQAGEDEE